MKSNNPELVGSDYVEWPGVIDLAKAVGLRHRLITEI